MLRVKVAVVDIVECVHRERLERIVVPVDALALDDEVDVRLDEHAKVLGDAAARVTGAMLEGDDGCPVAIPTVEQRV